MNISIVENNSTDDATFQYYKKLEAENPKAHVVYWDKEFNYSAINNYGAAFAKGEYLLLLNNDTEIINEDCLEERLATVCAVMLELSVPECVMRTIRFSTQV